MIGDVDLRRLGEARWAVPLLADILTQDGARFADLLLRLGIARDSLARTLTHAADAGWVVRNPGYGHPLRPEYVLTPDGRGVAAACARLMLARGALGIGARDLCRWSLPVLARLQRADARFLDLLQGLAPVTPRALSQALKQMIDGDLVHRRLEASFPPTPVIPWPRRGGR